MPTEPKPQVPSYGPVFMVFSAITVILLLTCCWLWLHQVEPPPSLLTVMLSCVGVFIGVGLPQVGTQQVAKSIQHITQALE